MTAQEYIQSKLQELSQTSDLSQPKDRTELIEAITKLVLSKKFRKYAVTPEYLEHIKNAIKENVENNQPINLTFLGGSYKLWRFEEAPESDWAELFAHIYFTKWLKPVCDIYEPGVWFDFFLDDVIVSRINNISEEEVAAYGESRQAIIDFMKPYQPKNMRMTITGVGSLFKSRQEYEDLLEGAIETLAKELPNGLPELSESHSATVDLNVKTTPEQEKDSKWREKVELVHMAYMRVKGATGYSTKSNKIRVFTQPMPTGTCIAVGATKDSITKFWVGVGVLNPKEDSFRQIILSPKQLEAANFDWEEISIENLKGKNFKKIRILE